MQKAENEFLGRRKQEDREHRSWLHKWEEAAGKAMTQDIHFGLDSFQSGNHLAIPPDAPLYFKDLKTKKEFGVVYNGCYGGPGLNASEQEFMAKLWKDPVDDSHELYIYRQQEEGGWVSYTAFDLADCEAGKINFHEWKREIYFDIPRHHPVLVEIIQKLEASGAKREMHAVHAPYVKWLPIEHRGCVFVDEYDGVESMYTRPSYLIECELSRMTEADIYSNFSYRELRDQLVRWKGVLSIEH